MTDALRIDIPHHHCPYRVTTQGPRPGSTGTVNELEKEKRIDSSG